MEVDSLNVISNISVYNKAQEVKSVEVKQVEAKQVEIKPVEAKSEVRAEMKSSPSRSAVADQVIFGPIPLAVEFNTYRGEDFTPPPPSSKDLSLQGEEDGVNLNSEDRHIINKLDRAAKEVNKKLQGTDSVMQYGYHKATKTVMARLIDSKTKEVIREIPPLKHLDAIAKMWELAGIVIDERR